MRWITFCVAALLVSSAATASERTYPMPTAAQYVVGNLEHRKLHYEDTLASIARREGVGYEALKRANPDVDPWLPGEGTTIVLPTVYLLPDAPREGIVINLSERRLYRYDHQRSLVHIYPVGIGTEAAETPLGLTRTVARIHKPEWVPPVAIREERAKLGEELPAIVPPGPNNPLGDYAIKLAIPGYFIHGTNRPIGVGQQISHGCIRLYAKHIEELATTVANGTPVRIVRQAHKVALQDGLVYLESHPNSGRDPGVNYTEAIKTILELDPTTHPELDWMLAVSVARNARGIPRRISG